MLLLPLLPLTVSPLHNTPNCRFRDGDYSTKFIPQEYPEGFTGVALTERETHELIASAVAIHHSRLEAAAQGSSSMGENAALQSGDEVVVVLGEGQAQQAYLVGMAVGDELEVSIRPMDVARRKAATKKGAAVRVVVDSLDWVCETPLAVLTFKTGGRKAKRGGGGDGAEETLEEHTLQYEGRSDEGYRLRYKGSQQNVIVRTLREHELASHMLAPEAVDVSKFLLCPMPGTLISCSVAAGQEVEVGQELAIVEAMKMQNVLRAERRGVVRAIRTAVGAHLKVDMVIMEFEQQPKL